LVVTASGSGIDRQFAEDHYQLLEGLRGDAPWPAEIAAVIDTDPECMQLHSVADRLYRWRDAVEKLTGKGQSGNAD
jgi:hypothetical protein